MRRLYFLFLPVFLFVLWLVLNESLSAGQIALGIALALWFTWAASRLRPLRAKPRRLWKVIPLFLHVTVDIIKSNIAVAKLILNPRRNDFSPGFIMIPLTMREPHGLAMLACIVTYTPGTVWVDLTDDHRLKLHVLDLQNEDDWIRLVQDRYERPLMEIFE
ncbi:Na(+)/H(+) antiporter subunit E [Achromobacter deleyi]|uniref:Na(+)/H(+) antiporter subunit E n=1 Tax=Achromobacter deleyi TaxID=1353891 RepID=A0A6S7ABE2_9BURK|nr:Na+/H+ antiporter subunit E [Achromobacter deleyi]CAB3723456.1 Na(+)/H(+) antiporter subunit E [Achromobacter deleyi]CAB3900579.1 Na(+)/H(+) antiporter subunit E [Achromobacter deleyi]CAB3926491.1 Na(+)/H(+) antiporter subunit E [Achromobacter deleyi]CAB3927185.1 Na(+)/H(+) antiporter subunit E [Achromobacter deleyi]